MEAIGQSHDVRLHEVKQLIVNEHKETEKKKQEVLELKTILAEHTTQPKHQQEIVSSKLVKATTELKEAQRKCHPGFVIAFDNIDFHLKRRDMTMASQNRDIHWVNHVMIENRVSGNHLPSEGRKAEIHDIPNIQFLPSIVEQRQQRFDYVVLVSRILLDYFDAFAEFKDVCVKHIQHKYGKEMSVKSDKVSSSMDGIIKYIQINPLSGNLPRFALL